MDLCRAYGSMSRRQWALIERTQAVAFVTFHLNASVVEPMAGGLWITLSAEM